MIKKTIHYCWFGKGPKSALNERCLESWQKVIPDYEVKEWNESNSPLDVPYTKKAYADRLWSRLSNYVRLYALYNEGGIYLDTDIEILKPLDPLLVNECFIGFQQEEDQLDWLNTAVLGAQPGHHFLKECLNLTVNLFEETGEFYRSPTVATTVLRKLGLKQYGLQVIENVCLYPAEYFYPYPWFGKFSPDCITENTFCIHHWEGSGKPKTS